MNETPEKLKPCPFCGGKATEEKTYIAQTNFMVYYVGCYSKKCLINPGSRFQNSEFPDLGWDKSEYIMKKKLRSKAIKTWNTRTENSRKEQSDE